MSDRQRKATLKPDTGKVTLRVCCVISVSEEEEGGEEEETVGEMTL